ncbi:MAG: hypothetical protein E7222_03880 [Clostridiales bacterium]|uniref:hypothetical protein n=1 Tax=Aminipila sp. TaxID=2060095 RepID=UPI001DD8D5CC|nr:hypothetical protein [Aminipila sp.]MBE6033822.1 hypothetical protein [Clostridiales bacterium]
MNHTEKNEVQGHEHSHKHEHHCKGGCCCGGQGHSNPKEQETITLNKKELEFLLELKEFKYLPISEFVMSSSENDHIGFRGLAPVYLRDLRDSMETVKEIGTILKSLEKKGLISLDYDIPLQGYDYTLHTESELYKYFLKTVEDGKNKPGFLCDKGEIEFGSAALTPLGEKAVQSIHIEEV